MYVCAQRVFSATKGRGVNVYRYLHGPMWSYGDALPDFDEMPGELVWQDLQVPPPGNRILSYLDVVSADSMPLAEVRAQLGSLKQSVPRHDNPTIYRMGRLSVRFGLGDARIPWTMELAALAGHLILRLPAR